MLLVCGGESGFTESPNARGITPGTWQPPRIQGRAVCGEKSLFKAGGTWSSFVAIMNAPGLSVIVPNYNHARCLPRCLDALLAQSVPAGEILVIDDASTDDSVRIIESYEIGRAHV